MTTTNSLSFFKRFLKFVRTSLVEIKKRTVISRIRGQISERK